MTIEYKDSKRIVALSTDRTVVQGFDGGYGTASSGGGSGGGGGGSSAIGGNAGGDGGAGTTNDISGSSDCYAGGGGGSTAHSGGSGGATCGGGQAGTSSSAGVNGTANRGGGGGGGGNDTGTNYQGGAGGSGIVILRFTTSGNTYSQSGGTVDTSTVSGQTIISYTSTSGTKTFTPSSTFNIQYLVVAGGGAGGNRQHGGGGGGGGYRASTSYEVTSQAYNIVVGAGGTAPSGTGNTNGTNGSDSSFGTITSLGGGRGGTFDSDGLSGGSGGGSGGNTGGSGSEGNGTTSDVTPTNVQDNSLFIEKDIARRYWFSEALAPTFEDDFTSYANQAAADAAYPTTDDSKMRVNITNDNIDVDFERTGSNDLIYYDLGSGSVNDTKWVLRFKWVIDSVSSSNVQGCIGLASNTGSYHTSQDGVFLEVIDTSGANFRINDPNNALPDASGGASMTNTVSTGTRYVEIARTGATSATISFSSTSAYTKDTESKTFTIENVTGLRYFKIFNNSGGTASGQVNGTIDDLEFYNGVTSPTPATWTREGALDKTGLKAYWRFNETSGNIINQAEAIGSTDSADNTTGAGGSDLTTSGTTYNVSKSPMNYSLQFDGSNDYAKAGTSTSAWNFMHSTTAKWTVCFWADMTGNGSGTVMGDAATNNTNNGIQIICTSTNGTFRARVTDGGGVVTQLITSSGFVPQDNAMHFYKITYDQSLSSDNMKMSVDNGTNVTQTKTGNAPTNGNSQTELYIGSSDATNFFLAGEIAEMSIWSRVLTDAEVTAIYNSGSGVFPLF